jgi:hypothetical protein
MLVIVALPHQLQQLPNVFFPALVLPRSSLTSLLFYWSLSGLDTRLRFWVRGDRLGLFVRSGEDAWESMVEDLNLLHSRLFSNHSTLIKLLTISPSNLIQLLNLSQTVHHYWTLTSHMSHSFLSSYILLTHWIARIWVLQIGLSILIIHKNSLSVRLFIKWLKSYLMN